jgi:hypothetical protein
VNYDWKNFKKQKTNQTCGKKPKSGGTNHVCHVCNHPHSLNGAIGSYNLLGAFHISSIRLRGTDWRAAFYFAYFEKNKSK